MNVPTLPPEILKHIFTYVDWVTLKNIRLTCKQFYYIVKKNIRDMQKPTLFYLSIESAVRENGSREIKLNYECEGYAPYSDQLTNDCLEEWKKLKDLEKLLSKTNLRYINEMEIKIHGNTKIFNVINRYFKPGTSFTCLCIYIYNSPVFKGFAEFMSKIKYVREFWLPHLCFQNQSIPQNYVLPIDKYITRLTFKECPCTPFINAKMIKYFIENNPELYYLNLSTYRRHYERDVIKTIMNQLKKNTIGCSPHDFYISFRTIGISYNLENEFHNHFFGTDYRLKEIDEEFDIPYYKASLPCGSCNEEKVITVRMSHYNINHPHFCELPEDDDA
uniref:F-box domain-containing protein n=1 Tax=Parastrongyloides trichosuri TaxID=131310 RepID=A0A0N4ZGL7_PARTI